MGIILYTIYSSLISVCYEIAVYRESEEHMLALKETFKILSKTKKVTQLEMAETLGISKQNFSNKVKRNTFSPDELVKIADKMGMDLAFVDKDSEMKKGSKYIISASEES